MEMVQVAANNLASPPVLAFGVGVLAVSMRQRIRFPAAVGSILGGALLLGIGFKGGVALAATPMASIAGPAVATLALGVVTPLIAFAVLRRLGRFGTVDAAALAAHYGSVSAVTFTASLAFLQAMPGARAAESFMPALVALLEVPAIVIALALARSGAGGWGTAMREILTGKSIVLLVGGTALGAAAGMTGVRSIPAEFTAAFMIVLTVFLLDLGMVAARRLRDVRAVGPFLIGFAILMPLVNGSLGVLAGTAAGLTVGGATVLGVMAASASYIAAPAAVRIALPEANPSYYLTASLGMTFPFNLAVGIPLMHLLATRVAG